MNFHCNQKISSIYLNVCFGKINKLNLRLFQNNFPSINTAVNTKSCNRKLSDLRVNQQSNALKNMEHKAQPKIKWLTCTSWRSPYFITLGTHVAFTEILLEMPVHPKVTIISLAVEPPSIHTNPMYTIVLMIIAIRVPFGTAV